MNGGAYYNENDPYAAEWLRNLIAGGHIAPGEVDTRSICDVAPADLRGFTQVHLFAGIGGWSYALRLAGVPDSEPVWTGSCPCQPFSAAGKRKGAADERHLWPEMHRLIAACKPERVFGEQVEAAVRLGWIDGVFADLAREDYACGFTVLGAHSVGAPHIRQRIYWVADAASGRRQLQPGGEPARILAAANCRRPRQEPVGSDRASLCDWSGSIYIPCADGKAWRLADEPGEGAGTPSAGSYAELGRCGVPDGGMGDTNAARSQGRCERPDERADQRTPWSSGVFIPCADGKARRVEPGIQPLAHGVSARVGKLRAAGNAIVPQVAAQFIAAALTRSV